MNPETVFELGIISDEISDDVDCACNLIREWGLNHVELRRMWGKNILELNPEEVEHAAGIVKRHGLTVTAVASPIFKSSRDGKISKEAQGEFLLEGFNSFEEQLNLIRKASDIAKQLGTNFIRIFTFWRELWSTALVDDVSDKLIEAARLARDLDIVLLVENEPVCIVGSGKELGQLFQVIDQKTDIEVRKHIAMLWDPGNASYGNSETPYPDGYDFLDPTRIKHIHLKDSTLDKDGNRQYVPMGHGTIDYVQQLRNLKENGYQGSLVLEPHFHPEGHTKEWAAHVCVVAAKEVLRQALDDR